MKFLNDIEELKAATTALLAAKDDLSNTMGDAARQLAELQQAIANAPQPETFTIKLAGGQEFTVSERDALLFSVALTITLDPDEVTWPLENGQTITLQLTDIEQAARQIHAAVTGGAGAAGNP